MTTGAPRMRPATAHVLQSSDPVVARNARSDAVEAADEDDAVRDRGRRVAESTDAGRPDDVAVLRVDRDDRPRARRPSRCARRRSTGSRRSSRSGTCPARRTSSRSPRPCRVEADDGTCIGRDADTIAEDGRARVDTTARVVRPADAAGVGAHREEAPVGRAEVREAVDDDGGRLDLARRLHLPEQLAGLRC